MNSRRAAFGREAVPYGPNGDTMIQSEPGLYSLDQDDVAYLLEAYGQVGYRCCQS